MKHFALQVILLLLLPHGFFYRPRNTADIPSTVTISSIRLPIVFSFSDITYDPLGNFVSVSIPLKPAGHLFLIEAKIDDETGNFVFDTGALRLVLNSTYFRKYAIPDNEEGGGITGSIGVLGRTSVKHIQVGNLLYENSVADVVDLGHIENRRGVKIFGLFGIALFKSMEMEIDFIHNQLNLYRLDKKGNRLQTAKKEAQYDLKGPVDMFHNIMVVRGKIGGKLLDFCLDTGAESNVLNSFASKKTLSTVSITSRGTMGGAGSGKSEVMLGTMNDFMLGDKPLNNMKTIITNLESLSAVYGYHLDGMLGYDFFRNGLVDVNLVKKEVSISLQNDLKK